MRTKIAITLVTIGLLASACGNGGSTTSGPKAESPKAGPTSLFAAKDINAPQHVGTPKRGGTIIFGLESNIESVSPAAKIVQPADRALAAAVFDPLVSYGANDEPILDNTNHKANQLADEITHPTGDLANWTVHLRKGVKFSNGKPLTAAEVISHTTWVQKGGSCSCKADADQITNLTPGTDSQARETVTYSLASPIVDWPGKLTSTGLGWITESTARGTETDAALDLSHLVGTGPFQFAGKTGDSYKVVRNNNYYGVDPINGEKLPHLDAIVFKPLAEPATRLTAVSSNAVQIMQTADTSNLANAKKNPKLAIQPVQGSSSTIQVMNLTRPPFGVSPRPGEDVQATVKRSLSDANARKARLAYVLSINRNEINQKYYQGTRNPSYGLLPESSPYFTRAGELPRFNSAKAKKLVRELQASNVKMSLSTMCINTSEATGVHQIMSQQQKAVGMSSVQTVVDQATLVREMLAPSGQATWNVACFRSGQFADPDGLYPRFHTGGSLNLANYSNPDVDRWLEEARKTTNVAQRKALYAKVLAKTTADIVYVPLLFDLFGNVHQTNVSGLSRPDPSALGGIRPGELYYVK